MAEVVDILAALGLAGAEPITRQQWEELPEHRRDYVTGGQSHGMVYLRLADPPPVAALRQILAAVVKYGDAAIVPGAPEDGGGLALEEVGDIARNALAQFDGTTSGRAWRAALDEARAAGTTS